MPQPDISTCGSLKGKETRADEVNGGGQTQCNASGESWLIQIQSTLDSPDKMWQVSENVCIYRVPKFIRISKPEAYDPLVVSFGPYHKDIYPELSRMDQHKMEAVRRMLRRLQIDVTTLVAEIQKLECEIRECYEEPIELDGKALSWMLVMDACFILEFLRRDDPARFSLVFGNINAMYFAITNDIMKLENQIPLFILITLLQLEFESRERATTELAELLVEYDEFKGFPFSSSGDDNTSELKKHIKKVPPPYHLLDLSRMVIKDRLINPSEESDADVESGDCGGNNDHGRRRRLIKVKLPDWMQKLSCMNIFPCPGRTESSNEWSTPSAYLLHQAGIDFKPGKLEFEKTISAKSTLSVPQVQVWDNTETLLRNLMAYEECQMCSRSPKDTAISHFVCFLDGLINSEKDVSILRNSQVIMSALGSDEDTARMFNNIAHYHTFYQYPQIEKVKTQAREHYNRKWNVWINQFKEEHFSQPWSVISFVAAILVLVMTAVQTLYSVK